MPNRTIGRTNSKRNGGPGNDNGDDNFSYSDGVLAEYELAPEAVSLFGGLKFDGKNAAEKLLEVTPFVITPGGGLFSREHDSVFREIIRKSNYFQAMHPVLSSWVTAWTKTGTMGTDTEGFFCKGYSDGEQRNYQ